ncbi:MAG: NAD-dependent epimerase/dehydratase family protein, partial [bacterium]
MKVFIIGGTGLISTAIRERLFQRGDRVVVFNRGISSLRGTPPSESIRGDRNDEAALTRVLARELPDVVMDMVAFTPEHAHAVVRACDGRTPQVVVCSTV